MPVSLVATRGRAAASALDGVEAIPGLPFPFRLLARRLLLDERTTTDALLVVAESLAEVEAAYQGQRLPIAADALRELAAALRRAAPAYAGG